MIKSVQAFQDDKGNLYATRHEAENAVVHHFWNKLMHNDNTFASSFRSDLPNGEIVEMFVRMTPALKQLFASFEYKMPTSRQSIPTGRS